MPIVNVSPADRAGFLGLVNAEIRPDRAKTNAWDDFPVILQASNSDWQLVFKTEEGVIAGCIACLIREHTTSCGILSVAGVGSVVTHPDFRGKGISSALQSEMMMRLRRKNIPLGVLWTDQPEIYSGRGFKAAGWEIHASVTELTISEPLNDDFSIRPFQIDDTQTVEDLFNNHPYRTLRLAGNSKAYYEMPGTRGFVLTDLENKVVASVFCGKGGDFPQYITEFAGDFHLLLHLFKFVHEQDLADQVLIPAGCELLVNLLVDAGAGWMALNSGQWVVIDSASLLKIYLASGENEPPENMEEPAQWLGMVGQDGQPYPGPVTLAVWGFDSV
ncbi:MAG: GNAT family N-acetyltransferase [bacterium]|nr:GNAT family N-acetyltransferase [bacterium]